MIERAGKQTRASGARNVLSLMLALWVSLAVQPCAVAAVSEQSCPHQHAGMDMASDTGHHHGGSATHAGAVALDACDAVQAECCDIADGVVSVRADVPDPDDDVVSLPVAGLPPGILDVPRAQPELSILPPEPSGGTVPLHIIKCVYLI